MTVFEYLRLRLYTECQLLEPPTVPLKWRLENLQRSEWSSTFEGIMRNSPRCQQLGWSSEFEQAMRHRLIMGAFRYGLINEPGKHKFNRVAGAKTRRQLAKTRHNREFLVDSANLLLLEFAETNAVYQLVDSGFDFDGCLWQYSISLNGAWLAEAAVLLMQEFKRGGAFEAQDDGHHETPMFS